MKKLTNDKIITEQQYIDIIEKRLNETEKVIKELEKILKEIMLE